MLFAQVRTKRATIDSVLGSHKAQAEDRRLEICG